MPYATMTESRYTSLATVVHADNPGTDLICRYVIRGVPSLSVINWIRRSFWLSAHPTAKMATLVTAPPSFPLNAHISLDAIGSHDPRAMDTLLNDVQTSFGSQLKIETLLSLSRKLQAEFKEHLVSSPQCMLPSHNYVLPSGQERGTYLAVEVGGSNLRVALVDLDGRAMSKDSLRIRRIQTSPISVTVRRREGLAFFDWIADNIREMLAMDTAAYDQMRSEPLHMGIAWAFPIE